MVGGGGLSDPLRGAARHRDGPAHGLLGGVTVQPLSLEPRKAHLVARADQDLGAGRAKP